MARLMESTAASRFTTTPRRIPRDSATPNPTMSSPSAASISPTTAVTLDVPTSSPTRYRSLRATLPPRCTRRFLVLRHTGRRRPGGPHVNAIVKPQVDVIDFRHPFPQRGRQLQVRLE